MITSQYDGAASKTAIAAAKVVDATYHACVVPKMRPPPFPVADGVDIIPLNDLVEVRESPPDSVVVLGAGKTGVDAVLYLLNSGYPPERIRWVMPRDSWFLNRADIQPSTLVRWLVRHVEAFASDEAGDATDAILGKLEASGRR